MICPAFTFYATAEAIAQRGATPVFADIDPSRSTSTRPTSGTGSPSGRRRSCRCTCSAGRRRWPSLQRHGLPIVEDAAQAFGAAGICTSIVSTFSFFPTKNLFALGDGGMIAVNDAEVAARLRMLRFHGSAAKKEFLYVGYNSRLDAVQASFLRIFLRHIDAWNAQRREAAARYRELLGASSRCPTTTPATCTTSTACARPSATGSRPRSPPPTSASPSTTRRPCICSRRSPTSATARATSPRRRRPRARTSACRSGPGSPPEQQAEVVVGPRARTRARRLREVRFPVNRHRVWQLVFDAVLIAAAWRLTFFLRFDKATPVYYRHLLDRESIALVVAIKLATFVALRLLQPLVALRLDARHVGRLPRRHGRLARSPTSCCTRSRPQTPRGSRAESPRSTTCCCSRSSPARGCSRAR